MARHWVVNASPMIILGKLGLPGLLVDLADELVVPRAVEAEVIAGPAGDPARDWLASLDGSLVRDLPTVEPLVTAWDLGAGETEVLSWAHGTPGFEAIVDDRAARNCASALGIPVRGTLGVLLAAKQHGAVQAIRPLLPALGESGLRVNAALLDQLLRLAGEE